MEGYFFGHVFFWLALAFGFWLLAFGFWLSASNFFWLFAFGFWLLLASSGFWLLAASFWLLASAAFGLAAILHEFASLFAWICCIFYTSSFVHEFLYFVYMDVMQFYMSIFFCINYLHVFQEFSSCVHGFLQMLS